MLAAHGRGGVGDREANPAHSPDAAGLLGRDSNLIRGRDSGVCMHIVVDKRMTRRCMQGIA